MSQLEVICVVLYVLFSLQQYLLHQLVSDRSYIA